MGCVGSKNGMGGPAYKASHTGTYACSAEAMWKSLSQWEPDYLTKVDKPAGELKDVKGSGVGATRTVVAAGPDGTVAEWGEKVTAFDAEKMTYSYRVTSAVPFPIGVETFLWTCKVKSLGPNKCEATVGCVFDSEAPDAMMGMLPAMYACRAILAQFCAILLRRLLLYRYKTWADGAFDFAVKPRPATGATINIGYIVPNDDADRVQEVIGKHTAWMTGHYAGSTEKLISCYFTKAPLFKEPTDPAQGVTDKTIFTLNEEFTAPEMVAKHIETAKGNDYFPEFGEILGKYGVEGGVVQALGNVWFKLDAKRGGGDVIVKSEAPPIGAGAKTDGPAYSASHTGTYDVAAETMWKSLSQWNPAWLIQLGPADIKDVKGEGVGAVRSVVFPNPDGTSSTWGEEVTAFDNEKMSWSYKLTSDVPFPMDKETFVCTMSVRSLGPGKCEATIGCVYDSPAPEALGFVGGMYKSWADCCAESAAKKPKTGATINILYIVPKAKADEVQAVFQKHANWMTGHYAGSTEKLISCYFTKAPKFNDPTDPSKGESDDVIFTINEEFTGPEMVAAHIGAAKGNDYFPEFGKILHDYGKVVQPLGSIFFKIR